jgi:hypothetical protein
MFQAEIRAILRVDAPRHLAARTPEVAAWTPEVAA